MSFESEQKYHDPISLRTMVAKGDLKPRDWVKYAVPEEVDSNFIPIVEIAANESEAIGYVYGINLIEDGCHVEVALRAGGGGSDIGSESIDALIDVDTSTVPPAIGQFLGWNGTDWVPTTSSGTGVTDHFALTNIGVNTHVQIDDHIADTTTNPHNVTAAQVGLGTAAADIATIQAEQITQDASIAANTSAAATNAAGVIANAANISTNSGDIANNTTNITTNAAGIASNDTDISALQAEQITQNNAIALNTAKVSADGSIDTHSDVDTTTNAPMVGQVLTWDGANFVPQTSATGVTDHTLLTNIGTNTHVQIDAHIADTTTNPHNVTATQVGLGNVDNTSDADKPVSTAGAAANAALQTQIDGNDTDISNLQAGQTAQDALIAANTAKVSADGSVDTHSDVDISTVAPLIGQTLVWDGANFVPQTPASGVTDHTLLTNIGVNTHAQIDSHIADTTTNPHAVTAAQVGLGNVDNTSDADKPVSTAGAAANAALQTQIDGNDTDISDLQAEQLVQNTAIALNTAKVSADGSIDTHSDVDTTTTAPITGQALIWDGTNFVPQTLPTGVTDHTLLSNIGVNTHAQIDTHIADTNNPHAVTATQVGLGNVDNTSDADKPVSTAGAAANAALQGQIDTNDTDIAAIQTEQTTQNTDIANNATAIATNAADIASNDTDIAANTAAIVTNVTGIATNAANIATNDTDIATIQAEQLTQDGNISANTAAIAAAIASLTKSYFQSGPTAAQTVVNADQTLNLTQTRNSDVAIYSLASDILTINKTGTYEFEVNVSGDSQTGARENLRVRLQRAGIDIPVSEGGTEAYSYHRSAVAGLDTATFTVILDVTAGQTFNVELISPTAGVDTIPVGTNFSVREL